MAVSETETDKLQVFNRRVVPQPVTDLIMLKQTEQIFGLRQDILWPGYSGVEYVYDLGRINELPRLPRITSGIDMLPFFYDMHKRH